MSAAWVSAFGATNFDQSRAGRLIDRTARHARKVGEGVGPGPGTKSATPVVPVVDGSDFDLGGEATIAPAPSKKNGDFESVLEAADSFATKTERKVTRGLRRTSGAIKTLSLEDDLAGMSIEDDEDLSAAIMASTRREPTIEITLVGRIKAWAEETYQLVTNPTPVQVNYVTIFFASAAFIVLLGVLTFAMGGVRLRGEIDAEQLNAKLASQGYYQMRQKMKVNQMKANAVDDIADAKLKVEKLG